MFYDPFDCFDSWFFKEYNECFTLGTIEMNLERLPVIGQHFYLNRSKLILQYE